MLLYIMSRPHSGSTILDILIGNSASVQGVGQLVSDMGKLDNPCACGASIRDCPFWQAVRAEVAVGRHRLARGGRHQRGPGACPPVLAHLVGR